MNEASAALLRVATKIGAPAFAVLAFYLAAEGLRGFGLAAGLAVALGAMLYGLVFGVDALARALPPWLLRATLGAGVLTLAVLGFSVSPLSAQGGFVVLGQFVLTAQAAGHALDFGLGACAAALFVMAFEGLAARAPTLSDLED